MIKRNETIRYFFLLTLVLLTYSLILYSENPNIHFWSIWLCIFIGIILTKVDLTHPLFWLTSSFGLYSTGYTLLYILGYPSFSGYSKENTFLALIALNVIYLIVGVKQCDISSCLVERNDGFLFSNRNKRILGFILLVLLFTLLISVAVLSRSSFLHKNEMLEARNLFFILGTYSTRFLTLFLSLFLLLFIDEDKIKSMYAILFSSGAVILFSLFTGERDSMVRFLVVLIVTLNITKKVSRKMLFFLIPIGMIGLVIGRYFKYYFVSGITNTSIIGRSFVYNFLTSDFHAAGENLQILLNNSWTNSYHGFSLLAYDLISPIIPSSYFVNVGTWFNNTFYSGSYSRAFTLLGEGYVIGGTFGVIVVFSLLGVLVNTLYKNSRKNVYWLVLYIYSIPTVITSFRSTLGTVTTGLVRIALLSVVFHYIVRLLVRDKMKAC